MVPLLFLIQLCRDFDNPQWRANVASRRNDFLFVMLATVLLYVPGMVLAGYLFFNVYVWGVIPLWKGEYGDTTSE